MLDTGLVTAKIRTKCVQNAHLAIISLILVEKNAIHVPQEAIRKRKALLLVPCVQLEVIRKKKEPVNVLCVLLEPFTKRKEPLNAPCVQ